MSDPNSHDDSTVVIPKRYLLTFVLVTLLFSLWGFANDITNPMVAAFKKILLLSNFQSSLVQAAFYGGYCFMAIPAALFIKRFSYKKGILLGLALYAGAALCFPIAGQMMAFWVFLLAYFVMTCGLSFLETTANPYILSLGSPQTATRRLNFAQAFNPIGSLTGMFVAMTFILSNLQTVSHDPEIAPILAEEAIQRVAAVVQLTDKSTIELENEKLDPAKMSLDAMKWAKLGELQIDSWISKKGDITTAIQNDEPVDWTGTLAAMKDSHKRLGKLLAIVKKETPDDDQWAQILSAGLAEKLSDEQKTKIADAIHSGKEKEFDWDTSPLLDGSPDEEQARRLVSKVDASKWKSIQQKDLDVLQGPYFAIGLVVLAVLLIFLFKKLPDHEENADTTLHLGATLSRLLSNPRYVGGVIAQAFYVGVQIMCWTFIIQYAGKELGMRADDAQAHNIVAMVVFVSSRFICTFLLKFFNPGILLATLAVGGGVLILGTIFLGGWAGLYCLMGVSACMSLMFPTIYGIALEGLGDDAKLGAAGLIMAIGGGCLMPPFQAAIMDMEAFQFGSLVLPSVRVSFALSFVCFVVIAIYGFSARHPRTGR